MKRGKRYVEAAKAVDRATLYDTAGVVTAINTQKQTVTINVELFGRETPVEISFAEIRKA